MLHFDITHAITSSSSSMMAYRDSESVRKPEPTCLLASVQSRVGLLMSKNATVDATVSDFLVSLKPWSCFVARRY